MLHEKIRHIAIQLAELAERLSPEDWAMLSGARRNLNAVADGVECLEAHFVPVEGRDDRGVSSAVREGHNGAA